MSKFALPLMGLGGAAGGYMIFGKGDKAPEEESFRSRYSHAILQDNDGLWATKLTTLKGEGSPVHQKLIDAKAKAADAEQQAKSLLIEGCREIYDSKLSGSLHENDFKSYCSRTIKDGIQGTWITESHTVTGSNTNKWNQKLTSLKDHNEESGKVLDSKLKELKGQLSGGASSTNWDDTKRNVTLHKRRYLWEKQIPEFWIPNLIA
ncbi:hypothetical protein HF1_08420 [Mycoplasma haemofelis str. Langford 1]|uniref:Uncharacterized protein n=1 Tax=Mycoplasma haemofelis (strain Langford 1) TaxID=941640 RepID=E8ZI79_MYCHL|nr:hypothetical protein [Mycoplasma haemofelis]CBY92850.1 hypothetical protein HF1_08420 [Mycoplasma haemofelis str. Langford 1]